MIPENAIEDVEQEREANQLDRRKISQPTLDSLKTDISNVDDPDAKAALEDFYNILTGKRP